jgi:MFS family permease
MPHVRRRMETTFPAPVAIVAEAARTQLAVEGTHDATLLGRTAGDAAVALRIDLEPGEHGTTIARLQASSEPKVPYFGWLVIAVGSWVARRELRYAVEAINAQLAGTPAPRRPRRLPVLPPVPFAEDQAARLGAIAAVAAIASFCGALFTQNGDAVTDAFHRSDSALGVALAVARIGVLVSLVSASMSDRFGRRRLLLVCLAGAAAANACTALAPSFEAFTVAQLFTRSFVNAVLVIAGLAAVEEAPEGARAYALSLFALAFGAGYSLSVILLPLADLGDNAWRIAFAVSALTAFAIPSLRHHLQETTRYEALEHRQARRGRLREVFDRRYGSRFVLLGLAAFLTNLFSAPSSQLTNRYLRREHDYSHSAVALFRSVTAGVPGVVGVLLAGRLAETRGRRPVTIVGIVVASTFQMAFFLVGGAFLWIAPMIAIVAAACGGLALGALDSELFPTEVRGTSSGFLLVCAVAGSAVGLVLATSLEDLVGGLGPGIALCGVAPLVAAAFIVPRLPETATRRLDDVSPSEG